MGNNQNGGDDPRYQRVSPLLTGPRGCEITGIAFTPDNRTLFINIQHPGEPAEGLSDPQHPTAVSSWPDGDKASRPRSSTVVIVKADGGMIGHLISASSVIKNAGAVSLRFFMVKPRHAARRLPSTLCRVV
ncbi:putative monomeric alkaline phosphatase PhoX [Escherichia coli]|uniref:Putative monomeric alkaline phosphatase PhoX n=1 Tax=Escherichia coli TaxID=562 RepID=A0A377HI15_ECOLX|nr:putative monomeric alkaline phosphatase PhoX [Escherichia coli]